MNPKNKNMRLNGKHHVCWQWTDFRLGKDYKAGDWEDAVKELVPHGYVWAIVIEADPQQKPSFLGTLFAKKKLNGNIGMF